MKSIILVDFDNTLSDGRRRGLWAPESSLEWHSESANDKPNDEVKTIVELHYCDYVIVTAKPIEFKHIVVDWLRRNMCKLPLAIYMRPKGSWDVSSELKKKFAMEIMKCYDVALGIDDREDVCAAYRTLGIPTIQFKNTL